jgi:hypothetical protein
MITTGMKVMISLNVRLSENGYEKSISELVRLFKAFSPQNHVIPYRMVRTSLGFSV